MALFVGEGIVRCRHAVDMALGVAGGELQADAAARLQLAGRGDHRPGLVADDAVAPGQGGLRVEGGEAGGQPLQAALVLLQLAVQGRIQTLAETVEARPLAGGVGPGAVEAQAEIVQLLFAAA